MASMMIPINGALGLALTEPPGEEASKEDRAAFEEFIEAGGAIIDLMAEKNVRAAMDTNAGDLLGD